MSQLNYILLLFLLLANLSCKQGRNSLPVELSDTTKLDSILNYYVNQNYYPFIYARIEKQDGSVLYEHSSVNEDLLPNTVIDENTWIRIWSMSKIITISLVLDLIEDGILNLDDPVEKYIPEFKNLQVAVAEDGSSLTELEWDKRSSVCPIQWVPNDSVMTLLHLINHEAGFYYANTGFTCLDSLVTAQNLPKAENSDDLIDKIAKLPLIQQPGTDYFYGTNTTVLGLVAERATRITLAQLVVDRMTSPLNIDGIKYKLSPEDRLLPRFTGRDSVLRQATAAELDIFGSEVPDYNVDHKLYLGGEGMLATADGYTDFVRMLLNEGDLNGFQYLEPESVEQMYAPHTQLDNPYGYNGYNLWISGDSMRLKEQGEAGLWIGGGYECTHFWADPKRKLVGIILTQNNEVRSPGYELNDRFRGEVYRQFWEVEGK